MEYTALIWSALFGYLFFDEIPGGWTLLGALVIVAGGMLVMRARD